MVSTIARCCAATRKTLSVADATINAGRAPTTSRAHTACDHCGLPVPAGLIDSESAEQFCCGACRTVYRVIRECGLDRYYAIRDALELDAAPARSTGESYAAFDAPEFRDRHCSPRGNDVFEIELYLEGVHCAACVWLVERLPQIHDGAISVRLELTRSLVRIVWDDKRTSLSCIARDLDRLGYPAHPARGGEARAARAREDRRMLVRIAVAGALAGNVMLLAFALYSGVFDAIESQFYTAFRYCSMALGVMALAWPGSVFFKGALASFRARTWQLDLPIALGLALGGAAGLINVIRGAGEIYFDSLTMLVFLLLVGRWLQRSRQRRAAESVELLYSLTPAKVTLIEGELEREAPIEAVAPGCILLVRAGETIPVDGVVTRGESAVNAAALTGESRPFTVGVSDAVSAGGVNLSSPLHIRADAVGDATRLGRIMRDIEADAGSGLRLAGMVDRMSAWFVTIVIGLALATLALWLVLKPAVAVEHAIALLIVTCPCALGLATPLAVTVALGRASKQGLFIKSGDVVERLSQPGIVLVDKTGTLTEGHVRVVEWIGDKSVMAAVAALESGSSHPIARALTDACADAMAIEARHVDHYQGRGVRGTVSSADFVIGSAPFVLDHAYGPSWVETERARFLDLSITPVLIARDGVVVAMAGLSDRLREDTTGALSDLRTRGWRIGIVSGDDEQIVQAVATTIGGEFEMLVGGASPEQKRSIVERVQQLHPVVFVGDGVNDAPALSIATVGVAVQGGAEASLAAADVYLTRSGLSPVVQLFDGAVRTERVIRRNVIAALGYNSIAASLAIAGLISPLLGAVLMPLSSLTVMTLSMQARTFQTGARR